ncbi:OmpW/AlkL family protein [Aureimonas populi]|uniref:OmpW family protein n=1 Tax=Aureimonas populi TaxID=1701758 RepID=A0ABW5CQ85_9HYPH|nr:OmpW family protein [Aureimonas populi]
MLKKTMGAMGALIAALPAGQALAADIYPVADTGLYAPAPVETRSPWQIRVRALGIVTDDNGTVNVAGTGTPFLPGDGLLQTTDSLVPELDITYYFTPNIAAELILGTTRSTVKADGDLAAAGIGDIGKTWILPPTLTLQYHFTDFGAFKPYVGAGVNYTIFYEQKSADGFSALDIDNTFGWALQAGFDYMLDEHWGINFDVKKLFLRPDWTVVAGDTQLQGETKLDPWLIGAGVTYRF